MVPKGSTRRHLLLAVVLAVIAACGTDVRPQPFANDAPRRARITEMTYKHDCDGLRGEFQLAEQAGDEDIMVYIDEHADEAGCFPEGQPNFHAGV